MRVTPQIQTARNIRQLQRSNLNLSKFQNQISSGSRISRPSDDPINATIVTRNKHEDAIYETHLATQRDAGFILESQVTALTELRDLLTQVAAIAIDSNDGSKQEPHADVNAQQVQQLLTRAIEIANTKTADGRSLFAGTATDATAFTVSGTNSRGEATRLNYTGSRETSEAVVGRGQTVGVFIAGSSALQVYGSPKTVFFGPTGARAGQGTSTSTGQTKLAVQDSVPTLLDAAGTSLGIVSGASITGTHVGVNSVAVSGGGSMISINGATPVPNDFIDGSGNPVALSDGFYTIYRGQLSTDAGATFTDINANEVAVTNSVTGEITYVDTTGITQTGTDTVDNQGAYDFFQTLIAVRDALRNEDNLNAPQRAQVLSRALGEMERIRTALLEPLGIQSARAEELVTITRRTEDLKDNLQLQTADIEGADLPKAIVNLQSEENALQSILAVTSRVNKLSLIDFLA